MKRTLERELKLDVEPGFRLPRLPGRPLATRVFISRYYDTPDHRLARHGVTLRCRIEKRRPLWQVKLPRGAGRLELELPGSSFRLPDELGRLLRVYTREAELGPIATLRTRRVGSPRAREGPSRSPRWCWTRWRCSTGGGSSGVSARSRSS